MDEVSIEQARAKIGTLANQAELAGTVTVLTRNGRPIARIAPLEPAPAATTDPREEDS